MNFQRGGPAIIGIVLLLAFASFCMADTEKERILFRISLENMADHVQARAVRRFAQALDERYRDVLNVEFYDSARLFRDRDVLGALVEGKVEMAVPGTWHVAKFEPGINIFLLPLFYGRSAEENHKVSASAVGRELDRRIENSLGVVVPGKWLDLGHAHLYLLNRRIEAPDDLKHLKIRVAGGLANTLRIEAMGGDSVIVPWPDLPLWLENRKVDGVLTTYETLRSARLWEHGLDFCFEDREYFPMYVPLISERIWRLFPEEMQQKIRLLWDESAEQERRDAVKAQQDAKKEAEKLGMEIFVPKPEQIQAWRRELMTRQQKIMSKVGVDNELYKLAADILKQ